MCFALPRPKSRPMKALSGTSRGPYCCEIHWVFGSPSKACTGGLSRRLPPLMADSPAGALTGAATAAGGGGSTRLRKPRCQSMKNSPEWAVQAGLRV
jgi:hypothetical protein